MSDGLTVGEPAIGSMLEKLHGFALGLASVEREALGVLLGPGIARSLGRETHDIAGFSYVLWTHETLADGLRSLLGESMG